MDDRKPATPITRRSFLQKMGLGAAALSVCTLPTGLAAANDGRRADHEEGTTMKVPIKLECEFSWLT